MHICIYIYVHASLAKEVVSVSCRHHSLKAFKKKKKKRKEKKKKKKRRRKKSDEIRRKNIYGRGYFISPTVARQRQVNESEQKRGGRTTQTI